MPTAERAHGATTEPGQGTSLQRAWAEVESRLAALTPDAGDDRAQAALDRALGRLEHLASALARGGR